MTWYIVFVALRVAVTLFFFLTAAYSILNYSPFVFYQFIRPRIFGWVNEFVASHHLWYCGAYLLSVITLLPDLRRRIGDDSARVARRLAMAYVVVFGLVAEWLVVTPYLPTLWNDSRSFQAALLSFVPLLWLAVIDHVATRPRTLLNADAGVVSDQRRLLTASLITGEYLWLVHLLHAFLRSSADAGTLGWIVVSLWALLLNLMAALLMFAVLNAIVAIAAATRTPRAYEYGLAVVLAAGAIAALLFKLVFPTIAFGEREPIAVSLTTGVALALMWSGAALRRPRPHGTSSLSGIDLLIAPIVPTSAIGFSVMAVALLPMGTFAALGAVEKVDWNFLVQKVIVVAQWVLAFGLILGISRRVAPARWSVVRALAPPVVVLVALILAARTTRYLPGWTGDPRTEAEVSLDRYAAADLSFKLLYDALVQHPGRDVQFYRYLEMNTGVPHAASLTAPDVQFSSNLARASGPRPHVFLFVLDSMRRDYLSPFNSAVTFTPNIERFASENFVFQNAFTHYGGTALAVPSIWSGGLVIHRTSLPEFHRADALEKLLDVDGYRWYMSLDTHMGPLLEPHSDLVELDQGRNIMRYDLCRTLNELEQKLDARTEARPIFAFTLPQNLHISNRQYASVPPGESYPGFFEPYAAEIHRVDRCFGEFVSYLKKTRLYDDSIVVLTTDHGDSLGESGNWGHGVTIYPEVARIPLVIHVPERVRSSVTADLTRVTFSTDIVPTLYQLLGHPVQDIGPLFGTSLFVAPDAELVSRRRDSFLLVSSYAATYGLLRRNGRSLYISDLVNGREYGYDLTRQPIGDRIQVTDDIRRVNQRLMREQIAALAALYQFAPQP